MKLSYIIPENSYAFFRDLVPFLQGAGWEVRVNQIPHDTDLILCGILPCTPGMIDKVRDSGKPFVLWHWDLYSFTDYNDRRWSLFLKMLRDEAADVWSCTYEVARELLQECGVYSYVIPAWVNFQELPTPKDPKDYAFYAASSDAFGKRRDWAERACQLLGHKLVTSVNQKLPRAEYLKTLAEARVYVMPAFEESNGTIPAQEAVACGVPLVISDLPSSREVFGADGPEQYPSVYYFPPNDFRAFLRTLDKAWYNGLRGAGWNLDRIRTLFGQKVVAARITDRLREIHARTLSSRRRG